jgi:hypothetical protein
MYCIAEASRSSARIKMIFGLPGDVVGTAVGDTVGMGVLPAAGVVETAVGMAFGTGVFVAGAVKLQLMIKITSRASEVILFMRKYPFSSVVSPLHFSPR